MLQLLIYRQLCYQRSVVICGNNIAISIFTSSNYLSSLNLLSLRQTHFKMDIVICMSFPKDLTFSESTGPVFLGKLSKSGSKILVKDLDQKVEAQMVDLLYYQSLT